MDIASFKRLARRIHTLGESVEWQDADARVVWIDRLGNLTPRQRKLVERMVRMDKTIEAMEDEMSAEQREELSIWAASNGLFGILDAC